MRTFNIALAVEPVVESVSEPAEAVVLRPNPLN